MTEEGRREAAVSELVAAEEEDLGEGGAEIRQRLVLRPNSAAHHEPRNPRPAFHRGLEESRRDAVEAREVPVGRQQLTHAPLPAHRRDLGVEGEVSTYSRPPACLAEENGKVRTRQQQTQRRAGLQPVEKLECRAERAGRCEDAQVRDHADELGEAEDRESPRCIGFGEVMLERALRRA